MSIYVNALRSFRENRDPRFVHVFMCNDSRKRPPVLPCPPVTRAVQGPGFPELMQR